MAATEIERRLKAAVDAAISAVQSGLEDLDRQVAAELLDLFKRAGDQVEQVLKGAAGADGLIPPDRLPLVMSQVEVILSTLRDQQEKDIREQAKASAENGAELIQSLRNAAAGDEIPAELISRLPDYAATVDGVLQQVMHTIYEDGLDLSDRIWRNWQGLREELLPTIQSAVVQGTSARDAARVAVLRSGEATAEQINQIEAARAGALADRAAAILASPEAAAYANALRVFRTEIDRANMLASRAGIFATHGVVGTRFLLSPRHPRFDICDMHASVNLYGLGPGGYPPGLSPLPAHPNTLSYEEAIFEWEVTQADRESRDTPLSWLASLTDEEALGVLGSEGKVAALRGGLLKPDEITKPWRLLRPKYEHLGVL